MANFSALKTAIQNAIRTNGNNEITGQLLQDILLSMVVVLGDEAITNVADDLSTETSQRQNADGTLQGNINAEATARGDADAVLQNAINTINSNISNGYVYAGIATPSATPVTGKVFYIATTAGMYTNFGGLTVTKGINILKYNGSSWSQEQIIGIDDYPTAGSSGLALSGGVDAEIKSLVGYYTCGTAAATAAKTIAASAYILLQGGSIKVKFTYKNTAADATLKIGSADAKPLFYGGRRAGSSNSWEAGEVVEIFYDGTNYMANNVMGGGAGDGAFDISVYNAVDGTPTPYTDLAAALGTNGANIPDTLRKGGMSVKFIQGTVQSSDNKYIQARCMAQNFTTDVTQWQGVDKELVAGSHNLAESGVVYKSIANNSIIFQNGIEPFDVIDNHYINNNGNWVEYNSYSTGYTSVVKGDVLRIEADQGSVVCVCAFFVNIPTTETLPISIVKIGDIDNNIVIAPVSGYIAVSYDKYHGLIIRKSGIDSIPNSILKYITIPTGIDVIESGHLSGYVNNSGGWVYTSSTAFVSRFYTVQKNELIYCPIKLTASCYCAFFKNVPTTNDKPVYFITSGGELTDNVFQSPIDGYVVVCGESNTSSVNYPYMQRTELKPVKNIIDNIKYFSGDAETAEGQIANYFIRNNGNWGQVSGLVTQYFPVNKGDKLKITQRQNNNYADFAFFSNVPTTDTTPVSYSASGKTEVTSPIDGYVAIPFDPGTLIRYIFKCYLAQTCIDTLFNKINNVPLGEKAYFNKTCLYIGDSISTSNIYYWKGYLETYYKLKYARDKSPLYPANGGIPVIPPVTESESASQKSIWYRCAENRMANYDFDIISLFGGTNDMTDNTLPIGTVDDIPYVDDASDFEAGTTTDVRPETLTFASALMGCIMMLQRDFPTKEIIIPTIMTCTGNYGNWTDPVSGLKASLAIALLQVKIAQKYGLKSIPLYWDMRNDNTVSVFTRDGVHPNEQGARRIMSVFVQTLCL